MTSPPNPPILLLKTKSNPHDNYEEYFLQNPHIKYEPHFVPVLEHIYRNDNLQVVRDLFLSGSLGGGGGGGGGDGDGTGKKKYGGLIFTSQRAVEGFARMLEEEVPLQTSTSSSKRLKIYSVGPATFNSLCTLRDARLAHAEVIGHDCGTGEMLSARILEDYNTNYPGNAAEAKEGKKLPLLFLMGKLHSDVIPRTLQDENLPAEKRIGIDELIVYQTGVMETFEREFEGFIRRFLVGATQSEQGGDVGDSPPLSMRKKVWVVVFSPTGCDAMLRVLNTLLPTTAEGDKARKRYYIATIGPTTRDHLISKYGVQPDVCAEIPSPEGVGDGIRAFLEKGEGGC